MRGHRGRDCVVVGFTTSSKTTYETGRRVPLDEHKLISLPKHLSLPRVFSRLVLLDL